MKFLYPIIICLMLSFVILGCVDENIAPNAGNVNVHVNDMSLTPFNECFLNTGAYPTAIPDARGGASLQVSNIPFNLYVEMRPGSIYTIFNNLKNKDLNVIVPNYYSDLGKVTKLNIALPPMLGNQEVTVQYIDNNYISLEVLPYKIFDNLLSCTVGFPENINKVTGKIIVLIYTINNIGEVLTYDNYGEKDVKLWDSEVQNISFSSDELKFNPGGTNFSFQVLTPPNTSYCYSNVFLNFDGKNPDSDIFLGEFRHLCGNLIVPAHLPLNYKIKLSSNIETGKTQLHKLVRTLNTSVILDNSNIPNISLPIDDAENICDTSKFCYDGDSQNGIYYLYFNNENNWKILITDKNKITLGELKRGGLIFSPNTLYTWWFEKYSEFNSIDDFLSQPYLLNPGYNSYVYSARRIFRTAP